MALIIRNTVKPNILLMALSILKEYQLLIKKVFTAYCLNQNIHLSVNARKDFYKKLLFLLQKKWENISPNDKNTTPIDSLIVELVRECCQKLFKHNNVEDIELLQIAALKLVVKYQPMIKHIVYKQTAKGEPLNVDVQADLISNIQAKLLQKANSGKLAVQYKGNSLFSTYFYKVTYHTMIDEWRKLNRQKINQSSNNSNLDETKQIAVSSSNLEYKDLLESHIRRLQTLLKMLSSKRRKRFEFALQVTYRIQFVASDLQRLYADCSDDLLIEVLSSFGKHYHDLSQAQLFILIGDFITELEGGHTVVNSESFRIWFQNILKKVKKTLFEGLPTKDKKTLDTYFEFLVYKFYGKN